MKSNIIRLIFWLMVADFLIIVSGLFLISEYNFLRFIVFPAWVIFAGLGAALIILTIKQKVVGKLKAFLLLAGASGAGFLTFLVLHNLISALLNVDEPVFFSLAGIICPVGFIIGVAGVIIQTLKTKKSGSSDQNIIGGEAN